MSGTSADGIDATVLNTDGSRFQTLGFHKVCDYRYETRKAILSAMTDPLKHMRNVATRSNLDRLIAEEHARAVMELLELGDFTPKLIGFHGQTIYHNPKNHDGHPLGRDTIQLGDAALLAKLTNIPVVHDVRRADMIAGGQGAPLAPVFHAAMFRQLNMPLPAVLVNIGGIANLTWFDDEAAIIGFDTGPGNALMDDYMRRYCDADFDRDGHLASIGIANRCLVESWLSNPFFDADWPKSLDRHAFHHCLDDRRLLESSVSGAMASLALFTVQSISNAIDRLPEVPKTIFIAGGGRKNNCLMSMFRRRFGPALHDGNFADGNPMFSSCTLEAELMAFLAARHQAGLPTSFPETTGCCRPVCGGELVEPIR